MGLIYFLGIITVGIIAVGLYNIIKYRDILFDKKGKK